jgi:DNA-binding GntR family transcriptional regulator
VVSRLAPARSKPPRGKAAAAPTPRRRANGTAPLQRGSLVDNAYAAIRQRILDNAYPPGMQALEQALAAELGISRTPVREALIRLQQEGLVEVVPRHGMRVLPVSAADMKDIYEILTALEAMAAELVVRRQPGAKALRPLVEATNEMASALRADDLDAWARADERFHRHLIELTGNRLLVEAVQNCWDRAHRARMVTLRMRPKPQDSTREHMEVVEMIRRGDARGAFEAHRRHRERGSRELLEILERYRLQQL